MLQPPGNRADMLKPDGQEKRQRTRPFKLALLLLALPMILTGWALVGMEVRLGDWELSSGWGDAATWRWTFSWKGPFAVRTIHHDGTDLSLVVVIPSGTVYDRSDTFVVICGNWAYFTDCRHVDHPGTAAWRAGQH